MFDLAGRAINDDIGVLRSIEGSPDQDPARDEMLDKLGLGHGERILELAGSVNIKRVRVTVDLRACWTARG